jgi:hypothetical protein
VRDLAGKSFGRLTAQWPAGRSGMKIHWLCLCACGALTIVRGGSLSNKETRSCGCLRRELASVRLAEFDRKFKPGKRACLRHGHTFAGQKSPDYNSWCDMLQRCANPKNTGFKYYGAKGITVCERWKSFENFLADMGLRPKGTTLGRFADTGNYQPGNCAWMTRAQQEIERRKKRLAA